VTNAPTATDGSAGYREVFRENRNFRLLWLGTSISLFGDWFNTITLYTLVTKLTGSPLAVGMVEFLKLGGFAAASIPAGILADRFDRRKLMVLADLLRAVLVLGFLFVDSRDELPLLYVLISVQVALGAVFEPANRALMPNLVTRRELLTANAVLAASWSTILAVGAAVGGLVTAAIGSDAVFVIDSLSYLASAGCLLAIRMPALSTASSAVANGPVGNRRIRPTVLVMTAYADLREGFRYLRTHRLVARLALAKTAWAFGGSALVYFLTQLGPQLTPLDPALGIGILYSVRGAGTGIGPILARRHLARRLWLPATGLMIAASGLLYMTIGWLPATFVVLVPILFAHAASGGNWVLSTVLLQELVPDQVRGRVFAAELMVLMGVEALVVLGAAALLETRLLSLSTAFIVFAFIQLVTGLAYTRWLGRSARADAA